MLAWVLSACMNTTSMTSADRPMTGAPMAMTDADRLHVFITGNRGEIVTSEPVVGTLTNPDVRQFAQDMIRVHSGVIDRVMALDLEPRDNPVSMSLTQQAQGVARELSGMSGMALDMAYVDAQIVLHGQTLNTLDYVLIPNTRDAGARQLMEQVRPEVADHLRRAKALHDQMAMAHSPMSAPGR